MRALTPARTKLTFAVLSPHLDLLCWVVWTIEHQSAFEDDFPTPHTCVNLCSYLT
jgi:hypothetical protein